MNQPTNLYQPSNGTEGEWFRSKWCNRCEKDRYQSKPCRILDRTMIYNVTDKKYPKQWIENVEAPYDPRCTAFVARGSAQHGDPPTTINDKRQIGLPL